MKSVASKGLSIILAVTILITLVPQFTASAYTSGDYIYSIFDDFVTIEGYTGTGGNISIPATLGGYPVRHIAQNAFENCLSITGVTLPDGIRGIQGSAFSGCENLESINIPYGTILIGEGAFRGCQSLTSISIPSSVSNIDLHAFSRCKLLASINVSANNDYYSSLDGVLFNKNKTMLIVCPAGKPGTFTVPASVTSMDESAFWFCKYLENIYVNPSNPYYSSINGAIYSKDGTVLYVCPAGKTGSFSISADVVLLCGAFIDCDKLTAIEVDSGNADYSDIDGVLFNKSGTSLYICPLGKPGDYSIPDGVQEIGLGAFYNCNELTGIYIPSSLEFISEGGFYNCDKVVSIEVSEDNLYYSSFDGVLFNKAKTALICFPRDKRGSWTVPSGVKSIDFSAFASCDYLTSVTIPSGVESIGQIAFSNCDLLESVIIPNSVVSIELDAFENCPNLTIYGYAGSYAQVYAGNNDIPFEIIDNTPTVSFDSNGGSAVPSITIGTDELAVTTSEDTFVRSRSSYANTIFGVGGNANALNVSYKRNNGEIWEGWVYLKFNVTGIEDGSVDTAILTLTLHGEQNNIGSDVQFNVYKVNPTSWSENTLIWNNKPAPDMSKSYGTLKFRGRDYNKNEKISIVLDPSLFLNGDGQYSVALVVDKSRTPEGQDAAYWSEDQGVAANSPSISLTVSDNPKISAPTPPTREGYRFVGWYTDEACTDQWNFESDTVISNMTLYAKWTKIDITLAGVVINKNGQLVVMDVDFYINARSAGLFVYDASNNPIPPSYVKSSEGSYYTVSDFINARSATAEGTNGKAFDLLLNYPANKQNITPHTVTYEGGQFIIH